jgi:hypothetical protein
MKGHAVMYLILAFVGLGLLLKWAALSQAQVAKPVAQVALTWVTVSRLAWAEHGPQE